MPPSPLPLPPAAALLAGLRGRGLAVTFDGEGLCVSPSDLLTDEDRHAIRGRRDDLVRIVQREEGEGRLHDGWDADALLSAIHARLDAALAPGGEATNPTRREVVAIYRACVDRLHAQRDPTFRQAMEGVEMLLARWRRGPAATSSTAPATPATATTPAN